MRAIITALTQLVGAVIFGWLASRSGAKSGKLEQQRDDAEGRLQDVDRARSARDRLNHDGDYSNRVRNRFTRRE